MERLKRTLSFRKKKSKVPECSKPHQWQEDEKKVRDGTCSFQVRYLGCIEVFESRGIQVCEEAVKALKGRQHRSVWSRMSMRKKKRRKPDEDVTKTSKGKYQRAILYVSGDALRVVDEISKGLIVDQTIEKVSFCAPDRNHEKGFAYICRDGTTRRWMCHGFLTLKEAGERLSHSVGCAFAICLEKKQKREKDSVHVTYNEKGTSFTRTGSFRQTTLTERLEDPQSAIVAEPIPDNEADLTAAVQRPHATDLMLQRQASFRGFQKLSDSSPFKRDVAQMSLRLNELPSTLERQQAIYSNSVSYTNGPVSPIPEASPSKENEVDSIAQMCQQLTRGLSELDTEESFAGMPTSSAQQHQQAVLQQQQQQTVAHVAAPTPGSFNYTLTSSTGARPPLAGVQPVQQDNPWATPYGTGSPAPAPAPTNNISDADKWLHTMASNVAASNVPYAGPTTTVTQAQVNGVSNGVTYPQQAAVPGHVLVQQQSVGAAPVNHRPHPQMAHLRSHSIDTADMHNAIHSHQKNPTLQQISQRPGLVSQFQSQQNGTVSVTSSTTTAASNPWNELSGRPPATGQTFDPFDAAWAGARRTSPTRNQNQNTANTSNPFQKDDKVTKTFEVKL